MNREQRLGLDPHRAALLLLLPLPQPAQHSQLRAPGTLRATGVLPKLRELPESPWAPGDVSLRGDAGQGVAGSPHPTPGAARSLRGEFCIRDGRLAQELQV